MTTSHDRMDRRTLNRALLARQHLLDRVDRPPLDMIEHLAGLQAQAPTPPYLGLWTRLRGFDPHGVGRMLTDRRLVRVALMRGTIHLVSARDALTWRPLVQPVFDRDVATNTAYAPPLRAVDLAELAAAGRALVEQEPRTPGELGALLAERWPGVAPSALAHAVRALVPLVQVPPRAVWAASGRARHTSAQHWLDAPLDAHPSLDDFVLRYLAAFGPARARDAQVWCGLSGLQEVLDRLRPRLRVFRDEAGGEVFDLPDAPRPDPDVPAPVRLVAPFDNLTLSHADRTRVIADEHRLLTMSVNGIVLGSLLVDGYVAGVWRIVTARRLATLRLQPFAPLPAAVVDDVEAEAAALLDFAAVTAHTRRLRIVDEV